jgi:predicted enzyme related to lactoylglutathione lyase
MPRIVHFEVCADDPERAVRFYREVFGWEIQRWQGPMPYWMVKTGEASEPGIDGAIMERIPAVGSVNTVGVASLEETLGKVIAAGGSQMGSTQTIPGVGIFTYVHDSEGNLLGLMQPTMDPP